MSDELQTIFATGSTLYAVVGNSTGNVYAGITPQTPNKVNWSTYAVVMTEVNGTGIYLGTFPYVPAGAYRVWVYLQAGGSPAATDTLVGSGPMAWGGTAEVNVLAITPAGGVTLADGVAHGGIGGSSTATLSLKSINIDAPVGDAVYLQSGSGGAGLRIEGSQVGAKISCPNAVGDALEIVCDNNGARVVLGSSDGAGIVVLGPGATDSALFNAGIFVATNSGDAVQLAAIAGHGINAAANGAGKHDIALTGDGILQADLGGRVLGNTATAFAGVGAEVDVAPAGLDAVVVEAGLNARQALSIIASSAAGVLAGAATTTITIQAAGVPATQRISAVVDSSGDRVSVVLSPPA